MNICPICHWTLKFKMINWLPTILAHIIPINNHITLSIENLGLLSYFLNIKVANFKKGIIILLWKYLLILIRSKLILFMLHLIKIWFFFFHYFLCFGISDYIVLLGLSCTSSFLSVPTLCSCNWCMFSSWKHHRCTCRTN